MIVLAVVAVLLLVGYDLFNSGSTEPGTGEGDVLTVTTVTTP